MDQQQANAAPPGGDWSQPRINEGQRKINGQLCGVDQTLIEILKLLRLQIAKIPKLAKEDFTKIDELLKKAYWASANVASVKPPGCEPEYRPDPKWSAAP